MDDDRQGREIDSGQVAKFPILLRAGMRRRRGTSLAALDSDAPAPMLCRVDRTVAEAAASGAAEEQLPARLMLYDGVCGLCNRTVRFLLRVDRGERFVFAPLQGETAAQLRRLHPAIPAELDTFVYVEQGQAHLRSRALIRSARQLPYPWKMLSWLWVVPRPLADLVYRLVARVRYRLFGQYDACPVPAPELRRRFLP